MIIIKESTHDDIRNIQNLWADEEVMKHIWPGDCYSGFVVFHSRSL